MKRNIFRVRCAARMYARASGGEANGRQADECGAADVTTSPPPPSEGNWCSAPPTWGRGIMFSSIESAMKNSLWAPHVRKYRSAKIKWTQLPTLSGMTKRRNGGAAGAATGHKRRSVLYPPIGNSPPTQINEILMLLDKNQKDMSLIKYLFMVNCIIMICLLLGSVNIFLGDSINKYVLIQIEKVLSDVKNSSKAQSIIKGMLNDILYSVVNDEYNKNATTKFFVDTLYSSKSEVGNVFTDVLQTEHVRNSLKSVFLEVSNYLCNNEQVQMKVYHLLSEAIHLPIAIDTSKRWLNDLFRSESVTSNVRKIIREEIFNNDQMINGSIVFIQNALINAMHDKKTKDVSKLFFASIIANPEFQQQVSGSLWKIVKMALSPKWISYEGDHVDFKVGIQSQKSKRDEVRVYNNSLLEAGNNHVGTISCDVKHVSDDLAEDPSQETGTGRNELLSLGQNMRGNVLSEEEAPLDGSQMQKGGEVAGDMKQVMSEMKNVINLFENAHICDGHTDVTECEQMYAGQQFQMGMARSAKRVDVVNVEELRSFLSTSNPSEKNATPLSAIPICKIKSLKEEGAAVPSGMVVLPGEAPLGTTSPSHAAPSNRAVTPAGGFAWRVKFFLLDAYRFYVQKYYFYYYYVERVKGVLQKALGVKFF
ncbi:hypothetical protein AK88_01234 [Plasmodium fragile]|uniref:Uncharacterized protein n=1 Tax=Plasmodium fragile TaxID=5857 RepID=A0A0D9QQG5_PLAFR|nr:uncharacterized protein AK88_01234 [Plasmodium fragile]KJP89148.1 hypothetical protein AK88_01234 [Plasmodium fragile]